MCSIAGQGVSAAVIAGLTRPKGVTATNGDLCKSQINVKFVTAADPHTVYRKHLMTSYPVADRKVAAARHDSALLLLSRGACNPRVLNGLVKVDWKTDSHLPKVIDFCMEVENYRPEDNMYLLKAGWRERITGNVREDHVKHAVLFGPVAVALQPGNPVRQDSQHIRGLKGGSIMAVAPPSCLEPLPFMAAVNEAAAAEKAIADAICLILDSQHADYDPQAVADLSSRWDPDAQLGVLAGVSSSASTAVGAGTAAGVASSV